MSFECEKCALPMEVCKCNVIFKLDRHDYNYKGVLFAELDTNECCNEMHVPYPPVEYIAGVMGIIWTDETGMWHSKMRIKFPSENKQVVSMCFKKEFDAKVPVNETYVLRHMYKLPMRNKTWTKNLDGSPEGIVKIIQELDMIESMRIVQLGK